MALQWLSRLAGTFNSYFTIGGSQSGVRLKKDTTALRFRNATDSADFGWSGSFGEISTFLELFETTVPSTPASNKVRLYTVDIQGNNYLQMEDDLGNTYTLCQQIVVNAMAGGTITQGQPVGYTTGTTGVDSFRVLVADGRASASTMKPAIGIMAEAATIGQHKRVVVYGLVVADTTGLTQGQALYISGTTAGAMILNPAAAPNMIQRIGSVVTVGASGLIFVHPQAPDDSRHPYSSVTIGTAAGTPQITAYGGSGAISNLNFDSALGATYSTPFTTGRLSLQEDMVWHFPVVAVETANISIASAPAAIDGVTLSSGDRILLTGQSTGSQNGIWLFNGAAAALIRANDYPVGFTGFVKRGTMIDVLSGTVYINSVWMCTTTGTITINTTSTAWSNVTLALGGLTLLISAIKGTFTHANTADRTYTFPDRSSLIALVADSIWLAPARVVTTVNVSVSSAPAAIDSVTLTAGDRILLTGQSSGTENGLWVFVSAAAPLTRPVDYPASGTEQAHEGVMLYVKAGTVYSSSIWRLTTTGAITINSTSTAWSQLGLELSSLSLLIGGFKGTITHANTADRSYTLPDTSGTMALTSDLPSATNPITKDKLADYFREPVVVVAVANVTVASSPASIDGFTLTSGDRILLTGQSSGSENGLWVFNGAASALTRPVDYPAASTVLAIPDIVVHTINGTVYKGSYWRLTTTGTITVNTTATTWANMSAGVSALGIIIGGFRGILTHAITAARTWTFPDASGTLALTSDIPTALDQPEHITADRTVASGYEAAWDNSVTVDSGKTLTIDGDIFVDHPMPETTIYHSDVSKLVDRDLTLKTDVDFTLGVLATNHLNTNGIRLLVPPMAAFRKSVSLQPAAATLITQGITAVTTAGTLADGSTLEDSYLQFSTGAVAGTSTGIVSTVFTVLRPNYNPTMFIRLRMPQPGLFNSIRFFAGFTSAAYANATSQGTTQVFGIRYHSDVDSAFSALAGDGTNQTASGFGTPNPSSTGYYNYIFEIGLRGNLGYINWGIANPTDPSPVISNSGIRLGEPISTWPFPYPGTQLGFTMRMFNIAAANQSIRFGSASVMWGGA